jgi:hypothetical protein
MPEDTEYDPTDKGTLRPKAPPIINRGSHYEPMEISDFEVEICLPEHVSPDDPITIFTLYYSPEIMQKIVSSTNATERQPKDSSKKRSRAFDWKGTCIGEIYIFMAIRIYMTVYPLNEVADYWSAKKITPFHYVTRYMARDQFQEIYMRYHMADPSIRDIYKKVCIVLELVIRYTSNNGYSKSH